MKKEYIIYLKNYLRRESFYIDILSVILGIAIIVSSLVVIIAGYPPLLKAVFGLSFLLAGINAYKGFRKNAPTRMIYAGSSAVLLIVWIVSLIRL